MKLFRLACEKKHVRAQIQLANHLMKGLGCVKNELEAFKLYEISANGGNAGAMYQLGICFEAGLGCLSDISLAIEWFEKSASWGDSKASEKLISLIANPALIGGIFLFGYVAPAA